MIQRPRQTLRGPPFRVSCRVCGTVLQNYSRPNFTPYYHGHGNPNWHGGSQLYVQVGSTEPPIPFHSPLRGANAARVHFRVLEPQFFPSLFARRQNVAHVHCISACSGAPGTGCT